MHKLTKIIQKETVLSVASILAVLSMFLVHPDASYTGYIDFRTLAILFSLMTVMAGFQKQGVFDRMGRELLVHTGSPQQLTVVLTGLCFFFSMLITNDVALITFVPFTFAVLGGAGERLRQKLTLPVVCMQTIAANLGSMLTPVGNPQNLYLYGKSGMSMVSFLLLMLPYTVASFLLLLFWAFLLCGGKKQPTVSRVLNGNKAVNPEIREKVLACAKEHDFQPNVMAQSLVGSRTKLIGVIVTDIGNAFFADLVKYIEQEAGKAGYSIILFNTGYDAEHEKECLDVVRRYRVDGLILVPVDENAAQWRGMVRKLEIPAVVITRKASGVDSYYLAHDEAGALAGRHLTEQGYEEFLFLGNTGDVKYRGFVDALAKIRPDFGEHLTVITTKKTEEVRQALEAHFKKTDHCTGIFAYNDRRAIQALGILEQMEIRIPEQAGVVGFDNTYICEYLYPRLSSIAQPIEEMAALTVQRLMHRLDHPDDHSVIDHPLHAELISRESSLRKKGEK